MADDQQPSRFTDAERGTQTSERGDSTAPFQASQALAKAESTPTPQKAPAVPTSRPPFQGQRLVIFYLGYQGHVRAGYPGAEARGQVRAIQLYIDHYKKDVVRLLGEALFDVRPFTSFAELVKQRPKKGEKWKGIKIITHGPGVLTAPLVPFIWLGDKAYYVGDSFNDILDAMNKNPRLIAAFQQSFAPESDLIIIACGPGSSTPDLGIYLRELFGVEGTIALPKVMVDFNKSGELFVPMDGKRKIQLNDWLVIPPKTQEQLSPPPPEAAAPTVSP